MKISVVINTYNAEKFLDRVLQSVKDFDEIVICDMHSTDKTLDIAAKYSCKVYFHEHTGIVEPARNYAISMASNNWILVIDADEIVTPELRKYLYDFIAKDDSSINGLRIPRKNFFMGRFMHASYPNFLLRFFRKGKVFWPDTVHTPPKIEGQVQDLPRSQELALIHLANDSINSKLEKLIRYTDFEIPKRSKEKHIGYISLIYEPFGRFVHYYIFKGGFRDGIPGFIFALHGSFYKYATIAKIFESRVKTKDYNDEVLD